MEYRKLSGDENRRRAARVYDMDSISYITPVDSVEDLVGIKEKIEGELMVLGNRIVRVYDRNGAGYSREEIKPDAEPSKETRPDEIIINFFQGESEKMDLRMIGFQVAADTSTSSGAIVKGWLERHNVMPDINNPSPKTVFVFAVTCEFDANTVREYQMAQYPYCDTATAVA